ncbi:MAG: molybdopterin-guanine dinucleotide biosynthesis protein B [Sulfolobales archaeon]|nr:molybdopterin-guanine dinucleotide biosynthesis protein B [Sulfolobales archaeon]
MGFRLIRYVMKIVSPLSNSGKTYLGTKLVKHLTTKGYKVGVVKHCAHGISLEVKDTAKYLEVGADAVIASSNDLLVIYVKPLVDDLRKVLEFIEHPVVIVEGYRRSDLGDTVGVARDIDELNELVLKERIKLDAVVSDNDAVIKEALSKGLKAFKFSDLNSLFDWVEERALRSVMDSLPKKDCSLCGFSSCEFFSKAYLKGSNKHCVYAARSVKVLIDGKVIQLNPFVENMIISVVEGLLNPLKGVPPRKDKMVIEISYK